MNVHYIKTLFSVFATRFFYVLHCAYEAQIKFVLFKTTLKTMKINNLQLFHISLSSWDI